MRKTTFVSIVAVFLLWVSTTAWAVSDSLKTGGNDEPTVSASQDLPPAPASEVVISDDKNMDLEPLSTGQHGENGTKDSQNERFWLIPSIVNFFRPTPVPPPTAPGQSIILINILSAPEEVTEAPTATTTTSRPTTTTQSTTTTTITTTTTTTPRPTTTTPPPGNPPETTTTTTTTGRPPSSRQIKVTNRCGYDLWISPLTNNQGVSPPGGNQRLANGADFTYAISEAGWGGRMWPKSGCDASGGNCEVGQSIAPCPPNGCDPPADTKVEFFFPRLGDPGEVWYDVSLVDGYSVPALIVPSVQQGTCVTTSCAVSLAACPTNEGNGVGDLRVIKKGRTVSCLAPCKKWNFSPPYGLGLPETQEPGQHLCCPTPPISPEQCRAGPVVQTAYVNLIHRDCPTAYSYAYDDLAGLHNCPNNASFDVTFCP